MNKGHVKMKSIWLAGLLLFTGVGVSNGQQLDGLAAEALAMEKATWQAEVDEDIASFSSRLAPDFVQVTTGADTEPTITSGRRAAVAAIEGALAEMSFGEFAFESTHARVVGNTVVLSFRFTQEYLSRSGDPLTHVEGVATSIWVKDAGAWQNVHFHWYSQPRAAAAAEPN